MAPDAIGCFALETCSCECLTALTSYLEGVRVKGVLNQFNEALLGTPFINICFAILCLGLQKVARCIMRILADLAGILLFSRTNSPLLALGCAGMHFWVLVGQNQMNHQCLGLSLLF